MIAAYLEIGQAIADQVKSIRWIEMDKGQLEDPESFNSIVVPGVLVGLAQIQWTQLAGGYQTGEGSITIKTVFVLPASTNLINPLSRKNLESLTYSEDVQEAALSVPGVISRQSTREYPVLTYYVVEETFLAKFSYSPKPKVRSVTVPLSINPFLVKPSTTP